jgi:hypothetical protein
MSHAYTRCGHDRTALACLLYVPLDVLTTQMIVYPNQYSGVLDCTRKVLAAEGLKVRLLSLSPLTRHTTTFATHAHTRTPPTLVTA